MDEQVLLGTLTSAEVWSLSGPEVAAGVAAVVAGPLGPCSAPPWYREDGPALMGFQLELP